MKDAKIYVLNRVLSAWGFCNVRVKHNMWLGSGRCSFTKRDTTKKKFKEFLKNYPEFAETVSAMAVETVSDRKRVIGICQENWRQARKRRKMSYCYMIIVTAGNLFKRAFSAASWMNADDVHPIVVVPNYAPMKKNSDGCPRPNPIKADTSAALFIETFISMVNGMGLQQNAVQHIPNMATVNVRGMQFTNVECGGSGNCFFYAISRGLKDFNISITHSELRRMLAEWLEDFHNSTTFALLIGGNPSDIIPNLGHMAYHCPSPLGWHEYTKDFTWQIWGTYMKVDSC